MSFATRPGDDTLVSGSRWLCSGNVRGQLCPAAPSAVTMTSLCAVHWDSHLPRCPWSTRNAAGVSEELNFTCSLPFVVYI